jgi:hypothetical protein
VVKKLLVRVAQEPSTPIPDLDPPFAREVCEGLREFMRRPSPQPVGTCAHPGGAAASSVESAHEGNEAIA